MQHNLCTIPTCMNYGRYCRVHKTMAPAKGKKTPLKAGKTDLQKWYDNKIASCKWKCEECGQSCYSTDKQYQHAAQAHLLPKASFPSVQTHPLNHKVLGPSCGCHSKYDSSWANASNMKIWPSAKQNIFVLIPMLWPEEYRRLPDILRTEYEALMEKRLKNGELSPNEAFIFNADKQLLRDAHGMPTK